MVSQRSANAACENFGEPTKDQPLDQLVNLMCPVLKALDIIILSSGGIFVALILIASIKLSLSQGDAKAIDGAKQTITWATIGFVTVIGLYVGLGILLGYFGVSPNALSFSTAIQGVVTWLNQ